MTDATATARTRRGLAAGIMAFTLWGLFPGYWKTMHWLDAWETVALRALLTLPVLAAVLLWRKRMAGVLRALANWRLTGLHVLTAALLAGNWLTFIWATQNGRIVEASLGYFLTPLANVLLGRLFLQERLRRGQKVAFLLAVAGVALLIAAAGSLPWVALVLCGTFALYGLLRKKSALDSLEGLAVESVVAVPVALWFLWRHPVGHLAEGAFEWSMVLGMGAVTAVPLLGFATAARLLPMALLGVLQFIAPSLQFLIGSLVYGEPVSLLRLAGFAVIWTGLAVFTLEAWRHGQRKQAAGA
jgi:chloramphenicol-sensitive protein RarD